MKTGWPVKLDPLRLLGTASGVTPLTSILSLFKSWAKK